MGGLGPMASAAFLRTLYELDASTHEQDAPAVILCSDPRCPPRTETLLDGKGDVLVAWLVPVLERLLALGATRFVVCCVTMHHVLSLVPPRLREHVISLVDVVFGALARTPPGTRHLMACSWGTYRLGLLQGEAGSAVADRMVFPDEPTQRTINALIDRIKRPTDLDAAADELSRIIDAHGTSGVVAGCTEIHLLTRRPAFAARHGAGCIDPLTIVARQWAGGER